MRRRFRNIGWTVGNHCNARCGHCYSWRVRRGNRACLDRADIDRIVEQLVVHGVETVNLGGNEPVYTHGPDLERTVLPRVIRTLHEAGIPVGLTTNGRSFDYLERFHPAELRMLNDIDFSLDSPFEAEHDLNRRAALFSQVVDIRCREIAIDCCVVTCGMRSNFGPEHLAPFLALTGILGTEFRINMLKPVEPALIAQMPTAQQFYEGFAFLLEHTNCITLAEPCLAAVTGLTTAGCPCGVASFRINGKTSDGRVPVSPCVYAHDFSSGDLLTEDLDSILGSQRFERFAGRNLALPRACRQADCSMLESCRGGCTSRTWFVHGDLDARDPYCPLTLEGGLADRATGLRTRSDPAPHGVRVHDNYLCTWIGDAQERYGDERYRTLEQIQRAGRERGTLLSGCEQVDADSAGAPCPAHAPVEVPGGG